MSQTAGRSLWVARISLAGSLLAAALGVLALTRWLTPPWGFVRGTALEFRMAPSTAVLFVVFGVLLAAETRSGPRRAFPWVGAVVAALAALSLASYLAGQTAWFDRLFLPSLGPFGTEPEGRMSPLTAFGFLCCGVATIGVALERSRRWAGDVAGGLGAVVLALGLLVGLTYVYGTSPFGRSAMVPLALTTALAFTCLGTALVALGGAVRFPLRPLIGPSHAARLARSFLPLVPLVLLAQAGFYALAPVFDNALRDALLSLVVIGAVLFGVLGAARAAGRALDRVDAERRRAEASEARLKALFESDAVGILFADVHGRAFEANDALLRLAGYTREEVATGSLRWTDMTPPEYRELDARAIAEARERGSCTPYERPFVRKDGAWVWTLGGFALLAPEREESVAFVVDITARKQSEAALRASEARFAALFRGSPLGIAIADLESGRLLEVNDRCAAFFGYAVGEMVGRKLDELDLWPDPALKGQLVARLGAGQAIDGAEFRFRHRDGGTRDALVSASVLAPEGQPRLALAMLADVTQRKELEARLRQAQSLEVVGRLAGGVAHEFNNLLAVILGHAERLKLGGAPDVVRRAGEIARASERAASLTRQLLAFSRRQVLEPVALDLDLLLADLEGLVRSLLGEGVLLVRVPSPEPAFVQADPGQLQQIVIDLCANAREAMPHGGTLRIETSVLTLAQGAPQAHPGWPEAGGDYVRLVVEDTGAGMDAATRAHLFEPFFSTKDASQGAGLGLPAVYGIVKQSHGHISVESEPGRGTRFEILLPRSQSAPAAAAERPVAERPAAEPPRSMATVLLAEDEPALRELTAEVLAEAGYRVLQAADARQALAIAGAQTGRVDLLVTDVVMPGMDGRELAARLRAERPELRVLFVSGYSEEVVSREGRIDPGVSLLAKPYTTADLLRRVAAALGAPPAIDPPA
jgi:two-component system cell cycle sensor histidine kinase/response regulator CckA